MINWNDYKNFTKSEFDCKATGENEMQKVFMDKLQELRDKLGFPLVISSGFRSVKHPTEAKKLTGGGMHTKGLACDIKCHSNTAYKIVKAALELGFTGIGINQKGKDGRFVHLDLRPKSEALIYSY